ncbi:MAG: threonine--tRNA ligase [Eubacterium sp.]|nr:threonine--tRNA ligase [Eubacterium sp.]
MKVILKDGSIREAAFEEKVGREAFFHTTAHILAQAVKRLYPNTKCAAGPAIQDGFYYDFAFDFAFSSERFAEIEKAMEQVIKENLPLRQFTLSREEAEKRVGEMGEPFKLELLHDIPPEEALSFYEQGEYVELCAGPHLAYTGEVKAFKLLSAAGSYWRGDEKKQKLTRIYGISFPDQKRMDAYFLRLEEAKKRDHRKLGQEAGLFAFLEEGQGFPFFLPKGVVLKNLLMDAWRKIHTREGYVEIATPMMLNRSLWETSGHWEHYRENMYTTVIDETDYAVKPMNCPGGMLVYKLKPRSYRDLPMRVGELGLVHRHEKSGVLHGLMRVRCFTQDDAHIFMMKEQMQEEILGVIRLIDEVYSWFGFSYHVELSTRPEHSIGSDEDWELATEGLKLALEEQGLSYEVNEGDGAFYGPKIDFHLEDSLGRSWQCGTIQLDFQLPQRFEAEYTGRDGEKYRPIMLHRVVFGSVERFIGILIEHYAGKLPLWLSPVQVKIVTVSEKTAAYARSVEKALQKEGIRCETDIRDEKVGYKIRSARLERVPYILVVGEKEAGAQSVSVWKRNKGDLGSMTVVEFAEMMRDCD